MSQVAYRPVVAPRRQVRRLDVDATTVAVTGGLVVAAAWLALRWWTGPTPVPPTWELPSADALLLLPTVLVIGLLAVRLVAAPSQAEATRLMVLATRWAAAGAVVTGGWLVLTVVDLYGGAGHLASADNVLAVLGADRGATSRLILLQILTLTALFGGRLAGRAPSAGLALLLGVSALAAFPFAAAARGHGSVGATPVIPLVAGYEAVLIMLWLGVLLAGLHLRAPALRLRRQLDRSGVLLTVSLAATGVIAVLAELIYPGLPTPPFIAAVGLAAVGIIVHVGRSQRGRVVHLAATRGGLARAGLVAGEVVTLGAVLLVACWLPIGG